MPNYCERQDSCELLKDVLRELDSYQHTAETSLQQISTFNMKYEKLVNELSTIINVFEYINLVTDYKNLFSIITDMMIGILGLANCTIFLMEAGDYVVETSNLSRKDSIKMMDTLNFLRQGGADFKETKIYKLDELQDDFSIERGIKSSAVLPLANKETNLGLIYIEHGNENYFETDSLRYLNTLGIAIRLSLENARLYARLEEVALVDSLTQLYNRLFFNKEIALCIENYKKFGHPFVLVLMDIDHFKKVNDTYGHLCGDQVLIDLAKIMQNSIRKDDMVCRYGGEEFAIIFRKTDDMEGITTRVKALKDSIEAHETIYQNKKISISCSFGISKSVADHGKDVTDAMIINDADGRLYGAKHEGRNLICTSDEVYIR